jgi:hypothetical protein
MDSLPFKIKDLYYALAEAIGLANYADENLILEFRIQDFLLGLIQSKLKEYKFHVNDLESLSLEKKFLSSILVVKARKMETFENFSGSQQGQIKMHIRRKNRALAEEFVAFFNLRISENQLKQMDDDYT